MAKNYDMIRRLQEFGREVLQKRRGPLVPISGQGIQRGTRFQIKEDGKSLTCTIKVAAGEEIHRIHFPYLDGEWSTLKDVDRILYVRQSLTVPGKFEAQMFPQSVLLAAFNQNYEHALKAGIKHLPAWLSPEFEAGDRFVGSGFGEKALWTAVGPLDAPKDASPTETKALKVMPLTIQEAKQGIAAALGISAEAIEIIIRT
jgi:hypothetical protein